MVRSSAGAAPIRGRHLAVGHRAAAGRGSCSNRLDPVGALHVGVGLRRRRRSSRPPVTIRDRNLRPVAAEIPSVHARTSARAGERSSHDELRSRCLALDRSSARAWPGWGNSTCSDSPGHRSARRKRYCAGRMPRTTRRRGASRWRGCRRRRPPRCACAGTSVVGGTAESEFRAERRCRSVATRALPGRVPEPLDELPRAVDDPSPPPGRSRVARSKIDSPDQDRPRSAPRRRTARRIRRNRGGSSFSHEVPDGVAGVLAWRAAQSVVAKPGARQARVAGAGAGVRPSVNSPVAKARLPRGQHRDTMSP